jgi:hypothetical protein
MSGTDFKIEFIESNYVKEVNSGGERKKRFLVKIDEILPFTANNINPFSHVFIIKNKDNTKQKRITSVPSMLEIAYYSGKDAYWNEPTYDIFNYINKDNFNRMSGKRQMYIAWTPDFQRLLNEEYKTEDVKNGGGARRKSKNAKRSRSKSRKSRKQRKSNKNRRTKYYKK